MSGVAYRVDGCNVDVSVTFRVDDEADEGGNRADEGGRAIAGETRSSPCPSGR